MDKHELHKTSPLNKCLVRHEGVGRQKYQRNKNNWTDRQNQKPLSYYRRRNAGRMAEVKGHRRGQLSPGRRDVEF